MKIEITQGDLSSGLQAISNAIAKKATLPILTNFLLTTKENALELSATDLEIGMKCLVSCKVLESGSIAIPAKRFSDIIREIPNDITIETTETKMKIQSGKIRFKISGLGANEFPTMKEVEGSSFSIKSVLLKDMIRKTIFANSNNETRYILNSSYLEITSDKIHMTATDGHRLATISYKFNSDIVANVIIPTKALGELLKLLEGTEEVGVVIGKNQVSFSINNITLNSKLVEGKYPDYTKLLPTDLPNELVINRDKFLKGVRRVAVMSDEKTGSVELLISENKMILQTQTPQIGDAKEEMDIEYKGGDLKTAYNFRYLIDVLGAIDDEKIVLKLKEALKPGLIKVGDYDYVIMPMKVS